MSDNSSRPFIILAVAAVAIAAGIFALRSKTQQQHSVHDAADAAEVTKNGGTRITRLSQPKTTAASSHRPGAVSVTHASASVSSTAASSGIVSERNLGIALRGPSGALGSGVGLTSYTSTQIVPENETSEEKRERWKNEGLNVVPVRIVDMTSRPLEGVSLVVDGIHYGQAGKETGHGAWRKKYGPPPNDVTGADGRAYLAAPIITSELSESVGISFTAFKAGYAKREVTGYPVDGTERDEVLRKGNTVTVGAYTENPSQHVSDFVVHMSYTSSIQPEDWTKLGDGRQSNDSIKDGKHALTVSYTAPDGNVWHSDSVVFEIHDGSSKDLDVQLKQGLTLKGKLSDNVPRPVMKGKVMAASQWPPPGTAKTSGDPVSLREAKADIAADGTFEIKGLPQGPGEIIGICEGYIAAYREPNAPPYQQNQRFDLQPNQDAPFVLSMEKSGGLRARIVNAAGQPLPGAILRSWPNVYWSVGMATMYMDSDQWQATADSMGYAVIHGLRAGSQPYYATAVGWGLPIVVDNGGRAVREARAAIVPGLTTELVVKLEQVPLSDSDPD